MSSSQIEMQRNQRALVVVAPIANCVFWAYFWTCFARAARLDSRLCIDHCLDPYTFFGYGIGLNFNPLALPFMKLMIRVQLPSFAIATIVQNVLFGPHDTSMMAGIFGDNSTGFLANVPNGFGGKLVGGISINGYRLVVVMLLSFVQWILLARLLNWWILRSRRDRTSTA
jgi:hypothetical protein